MTKTMISAENIDRYFADKHAVQNLSFELKQGDVLGFLGPNGAGKSTTMQMLCGVLAPTHGRILINGIDLLANPKEAKYHLGYLPEIPPLYPELTVKEYLLYCARLRRVEKHAVKKSLQLALQRCDLLSVEHRVIAHLSKGFQQRVGIAQAIIHQPSVIILDEPSVGLDPSQAINIRDLISELSQQHSIILSTHILPEVQAVCNRVQIMHQGQLVYNNRMSELQQASLTNDLHVHFSRPPGLEEIKAIDGIKIALQLDTNHFLISSERADINETISHLAVNLDWGLQEMYRDKQTLEQIFIKLTSCEAQAA